MATPQADQGFITFTVGNETIDAGFEDFPKALFIPKKAHSIAKNIGIKTKSAFGSGIWALVNNHMEETDLISRI